MIKLYELLAKVGSNPKLRAWAMEQLIKLKHLKPRYKKSWDHKMDLNKVKDIKNDKIKQSLLELTRLFKQR